QVIQAAAPSWGRSQSILLLQDDQPCTIGDFESDILLVELDSLQSENVAVKPELPSKVRYPKIHGSNRRCDREFRRYQRCLVTFHSPSAFQDSGCNRASMAARCGSSFGGNESRSASSGPSTSKPG